MMNRLSSLALPLILMSLTACGGKDQEYDVTGTFEATEVTVSANAQGELLSLRLQEGDTLRAGEPIGLIDTTQLHLRKMQLYSSIHALGGRRSNVPVQIASLREQIAVQRRELARFTELQRAGAATTKQVDDLTAQLAVLERQLSAQTDALGRGNQGLSDEAATLSIQVLQVEDEIKKSILTSPIDGIVLAKYAEAGELAVRGRALFRVADLRQMYLRAYVDASLLAQLRLGQEVTVSADAGKGERRQYKGRLCWISDKAEFTPKTIQTRDERANLVYAIKVAVANDGLLKLGMYAEVRF